MQKRKIFDNIYWLGAIDRDRRLFDSLIPLPDGTTCNAYLVQGSEKTALLASALKPKTRFLSVIGSYGWGGKTVETLAGMIPNLKVEVLEPVLCKGVPSSTDFAALERLAGAIAAKHKENGFA